MKYDPDLHHRRSIRLPGYNYAQTGAYFVTICTENRLPLFGGITNGEMQPNDATLLIQRWWQELPRKFPNLSLDETVIMPNHLHGIIVLDPSPWRAATQGRPYTPDGPTLGHIVGWFKTMTTNAYIHGIRENRLPPFERRLWQRNYYEHIVRNDGELSRIRTYIAANPAKWADDIHNPLAPSRPSPTEPWQL